MRCFLNCAAGFALICAAATTIFPQAVKSRPDGLYAEMHTSKGLIVARLEPDLTPLAVSSFVGLAEGTIANAAFDLGHPFFDGTVYHRVVPGHVIQTGVPKSDRARGPGYSFPNEVVQGLSHNHAGAMNMANSGPGTNASQFCIMLGDRSYLDGDFTVFGDVVEGLDVVMKIVQGDVLESVRILRVGAKAQAFHPTTESFHVLLDAAQKRAAEQVEKKRQAEQEWIAATYPKATGPAGGVLTEQLSPPAAQQAGATGARVLNVRYHGIEARYAGDVINHTGPPIQPIHFVSTGNGSPAFLDQAEAFPVEVGKTKLNPGLDPVIASMQPGERRLVVIPADKGYGRAGLYPPEVPGRRRFVVSPNALLVYDVEVLSQ